MPKTSAKFELSMEENILVMRRYDGVSAKFLSHQTHSTKLARQFLASIRAKKVKVVS